jgi:hypothetical protein
MHSEQQQVVGGSDPEDVEAACVLVGASMGRAHSGELYGMYDSMQQQHSGSFGHRYSAGADDSQLSPRYGSNHARQAGGRRRGHNWSKPLDRPPRPPPVQQQQGGNGHLLARRHSLTNGNSLPQQQYQQQGLYGAEQVLHHAHSTSQELPPLGGAASPRMARPASLPEPLVLRPGAQQQQQQQARNGSCLLFGTGDSDGKAGTLRALLDAVGEVQASSNRPDLMYPMQYGGLPMGPNPPAEPARPCAAALPVPHVHMSAAAAALLAAVPSLEALQNMAAMQGQAGLLACLNGSAPSLFQ